MGQDLHVYLDGEENPALIIEDYYSADNPDALQGMQWDGQLYAYHGEDIASSEVLPLSLSDQPLGEASLYFVPETGVELSELSWWLIGGGAALLAGGIAFGAGSSGGGSDSDDRQELIPPPDISDINVITDNKETTVSGKTEPGSSIVIKDKDGQIVGQGEADKDGNFEIKVPGNGGNLDGGSIVVTTPEGGESVSVLPPVQVSPDGNTDGSTDGQTGGNTDGSTDGQTGGNTDGSTDGQTGGNTDGSTDGSTDGQTGGNTDGSTDGQTGGNTDGSTDGSTDGQTGGNTDGSTDGQTGGNTDGSTDGQTGGNTDGST
ncbi:TPA: hypothetical protein JAN03_11800, partial [Citrobacter freundii]|nr:hypothetical protein [Citrobacter freundii]